MRDPDTGMVLPNAHIIGFLRRICKLLYHGIRPVMIFDGQSPQIKLKEIKQRRETREGHDADHQAAAIRMAKRTLVAQLKVTKKQAHPAEDTADSECSISDSQGNAAFAPGFFMEERSDVGRADKDGPGNANHTENVGFDPIDLNDDENSLKGYFSQKKGLKSLSRETKLLMISPLPHCYNNRNTKWSREQNRLSKQCQKKEIQIGRNTAR